MTDRKLHAEAYSEWRDNAADEYVAAQRQAFLDGFETAASEAQEFRLLRDWLEDRRDEAKECHSESGDTGDFAQYHAFVEVLVKLSEVGCDPTEDDYE